MNDNEELTPMKAAQNAARRLIRLIDLIAPQEVIENEVALIKKFVKMHYEAKRHD